MTETFLSLLGLSFGIIGANVFGVKFKKYSFGFTGNTLIGVFGSTFLIKSFGRLGFAPTFIVKSGEISSLLFSINLFISFLGGALAVYILFKIKSKLNKG